MGERSFGARWWRESLGVARWAGRPGPGTFGLLGALSLASGCAPWPETRAGESQLADSRDEVEVNVAALKLQRQAGWDVGQSGVALAFPDSTVEDRNGSQAWRAAMNDLAGTLAPSSPALRPFYVPTLFQSLIGTAGQGLRAVMRPIHTADMESDFGRGVALREQLAFAEWPKDTAIVVDAPGPRAVALAAALADRYAPVFTFGNWPHPLGVVPAHQTLAAALFYLPMFRAADAQRSADAPPLFVLDANRLAPYGDADRQFDNRYFVHLPTAEQLAALGITHVLYVSAEAQELDDLNAALVALCEKGVDVKMVALDDFVRTDGDPAVALAPPAPAPEAEEVDDDAAEPSTFVGPWYGNPLWWVHRNCYGYRGVVCSSGLFWRDLGRSFPHSLRGSRRGPLVPPPGHRAEPLPASRASLWRPTVRPTILANFGHVAVRTSRADGHLVAVRPGAAAFHSSAPGVAGHGFHPNLSSSTFHGANLSGVRSGSMGRASFSGGG